LKAIRFDRFGTPDVLTYAHFPEPLAGPNDVLVRLEASSVSGWDVKYRRGELPDLPGRRRFPLPMQPGRDAVGIVERIGENVRRFVVGAAVIGFVHPTNPYAPAALRGRENLVGGIDLPGHTMFGGNAAFVARPEAYWLPRPPGVAPADVAAALWSYSTALHLLQSRLQVTIGERLLVIGASGGMGTATLDLARAMGLSVTAVTRDEHKADWLMTLGAAEVLVSGDANATALATRFDHAIDFSGEPDNAWLCIEALDSGGKFAVIAGERHRTPLPVDAATLIQREIAVIGVRASTLQDQATVIDLLASKTIKPAIDSIVPLADVADAHRKLEAGHVRGRIVVSPLD
jgi:NADPH:quinone reductase-like Zn-dependent oxidoreductase